MEPAEEPARDIDISAAASLARLEPLPYPRRMRALALHARRLAGTSQLRVLLDELFAQDQYARRTALHVAMAARDLDFIQEVLAGPDMELRRAALRAVRTLPVPDPAVAAALQDAPTELRLALYRTLAQSPPAGAGRGPAAGRPCPVGRPGGRRATAGLRRHDRRATAARARPHGDVLDGTGETARGGDHGGGRAGAVHGRSRVDLVAPPRCGRGARIARRAGTSAGPAGTG